jgi:hypothetical protein
MLQYIIILLIGIAVIIFVAKKIYKTFFQKNSSSHPCGKCPGCDPERSQMHPF